MKLACVGSASGTGRIRRRPSSRCRLVRRHVERVSNLVRHHDRRDVFQVAQLDDFVVDRRRR